MNEHHVASPSTTEGPLGNPSGPNDEDFYTRLARRYVQVEATSRRPATDLARVEGVTPRTVQRWTARARELGLLHPGRQGNWGAHEGQLRGAAETLGVPYPDLVIALRKHLGGGSFRISATEEQYARELRGDS